MRYHGVDTALLPRTFALLSARPGQSDACDDDETIALPAYAGGGFARATVIRTGKDDSATQRRGAGILFDGTFTYL